MGRISHTHNITSQEHVGMDKTSKTKKSRAAQKFLATHPTQHQLLVTLMKSARQNNNNKVLWKREEEMNNELSNMVKNEALLKFRKDDLECEQERKRQKVQKRVTWSNNLFDIRSINCRHSQKSKVWTGQNYFETENKIENNENNWLNEKSPAIKEESKHRREERENLKLFFPEQCYFYKKER